MLTDSVTVTATATATVTTGTIKFDYLSNVGKIMQIFIQCSDNSLSPRDAVNFQQRSSPKNSVTFQNNSDLLEKAEHKINGTSIITENNRIIPCLVTSPRVASTHERFDSDVADAKPPKRKEFGDLSHNIAGFSELNLYFKKNTDKSR